VCACVCEVRVLACDSHHIRAMPCTLHLVFPFVSVCQTVECEISLFVLICARAMT